MSTGKPIDNIGGIVADKIDGNATVYNEYNYVEKRKIYSLLPHFIKDLAKITLTEGLECPDEILREYDISEKIPYNNLVKHKDIADNFGEFYLSCENSFLSIAKNIPFAKERILRSINSLYIKVRADYVSKYAPKTPLMQVIKENADNIIDNIYEELKDRLHSDAMIKINEEDIDYCLPIFLGYAFAECKILEKPPK